MSDASDANDKPRTERSATGDVPPLALELLARARAASRRVFLLDYDGTLVPFAPSPEAARPDGELLRLLDKLAFAHETWVISGRGRANLEAMLGTMPIGLGAEHGAWARPWGAHGAEPWRRMIPENAGTAYVLPALQSLVERYPGSRLERKDTSVTWHYRLAAPRPDQQALARIEAELRRLASEHDSELLEAVLAFEVRPRGANKGLIVELVGQRRPFADAFVLIAGDDVTDADLFRGAPPHAVRIAVGDRLQGATHRVDAPKTLRALLDLLASP